MPQHSTLAGYFAFYGKVRPGRCKKSPLRNAANPAARGGAFRQTRAIQELSIARFSIVDAKF
jgi:hypothetical protein